MALLVLNVNVQPGDGKLDVTYDHQVTLADTYRATATLIGGTQPAATDSKKATDANVGKATLGGLVDGTPYTVQVDALSAAGALLARGATVATPLSPLTLNLQAGDRTITATFVSTLSPPASQFRATATAPSATTGTATGAASPLAVGGLDNDHEYTVLLEALGGTGGTGNVLASASGKATPKSPITVQLTPGDRRIDVAFTVTGTLANLHHFVVSSMPTSQTPQVLATQPFQAALTSLQNGTPYVVTVAAFDNATSPALLSQAKAMATPESFLQATAIPGDKTITVLFGLVKPPTTTPTSYRISLSPAAAGPFPNAASGQVITGLANGTKYDVTVEALGAAGNTITSAIASATPAGAAALRIPAPDLHPLNVADPALVDLRRQLLDALRVGSKWRFDYLRNQVVAIAEEAEAFEQEIEGLMTLDVIKDSTAELLLPPYLTSVASTLQALLGKVKQLPRPDVEDPARALADAINTLVLLERLLDWLARNDALEFWRGLFSRLIDDVAAFDTSLSRTHRYLRDQFGQTTIEAAVTAMVAGARSEILALLDEAAAPLRAAIGEAIGKTATAMQAVFDAFDEPLLVDAGAPDAPGVTVANPLGSLSQQLADAVEAVIADLEAAVEQALDLQVNPTAAALLFEAIVVTYVVLPILSALAVTIAGGPLSAAILAAAVTLAAQELLHLLARWLSGPLRRQLEDVRARVDAAVQDVARLVGAALPAELGATTDPSAELKLLAGQLGTLQALLPKPFLDQAARLLAEARDTVLSGATQIALAAEQALGFENATVFDEIEPSYWSSLPPAPRLSGGLGKGRFAAAELLRDLGRLDRRRLDLLDGKEIELTLRLSLFRELGGRGDPASPTAAGYVAGELPRLLRGEEVAVRLREQALLQHSHPGVYRALISDVSVRGVFDQPLTGVLRTANIPVQVTHLGESRTRVRTDANLSPVTTPEKWGPAYLEADRDPQVAALGFATFVRDLPPESVTFNLLAPDDPQTALQKTTTADAGLPPGLPLSRDAQYRPFENRGLEGTLLLHLPGGASVTNFGDGATGLPAAATAPRLLDLVLDITLRACFDSDLAALVRAREREAADELALASGALGPGTQAIVAPPLPVPSESDRRTIHFSMRAYRDEVLRLWKGLLPEFMAEKGVLPNVGAQWASVAATPQLAADAAFAPLPLDVPTGKLTPLPDFTLSFAKTPPAATTASAGTDLAAIGRKLVVTPDMLGIAGDLLTETASGAGLVGMSVSIVPTKAGATVFKQVPVANPAPWGSAVQDASLAAFDGELHASLLGGASGRLYDARRLLGVWEPFAAGPQLANATLTRLATTGSGRELNALALAGGSLWHAVRKAGGWTPWVGVIKPPHVHSPNYTSVGAAEVAGDLHVCVVQTLSNSNKIWHTQLPQPAPRRGFDDVFAATGYRDATGWVIGGATQVACTERNGELQLFAILVEVPPPQPGITFLPITTIARATRHRNGTWTAFGSIAADLYFTAIGTARVGRDLHVCWLDTRNKIWHVSQSETDKTSSRVEVTAKAGSPGIFKLLNCAAADGELKLIGVTTSGKVYLTSRHADGSWDGWADLTVLAATTIQVQDPLDQLKLLATGAVAQLLPQFATSTKPDGRLTIAPLAAPTVGFGALFDPTAPAGLKVDLDDPLSKGLIYDVIFSLTYSIPVETITPST